jgi:hypothetical protein
MRTFLYVTGCALLLGAAGAMAFLPSLAPGWLLFGLVGAALSLLLGAAWVALSATAGDWPRPHVGPVLAMAGILALGFGLFDGNLLSAAWAGAVALGGLVTALLRRARRMDGRPRHPGPVQAPLRHRERL